MTGTIINIITVLIGSTIGLLIRTKIPENYKLILLQAIGLLTLVIGLQMAFKTQQILIMMSALLVGAISGQFLDINGKIESFADQLKKKFAAKNDKYFSEGFITASIIFCVGPMTILGALNDGLEGDYELLAIKAILDGFTSIALSATFGIGVLFSILTIFIIQGGISFLAIYLEPFLTQIMIAEMTAVGGIMIVAIGIVILDIKKIKVANFLPALIFSPLFVFIKNLLFS
jgi:uncharacterized membrane protein YqgA involved in biofilm formation